VFPVAARIGNQFGACARKWESWPFKVYFRHIRKEDVENPAAAVHLQQQPKFILAQARVLDDLFQEPAREAVWGLFSWPTSLR
jgi:hypothetical protein